MDGIFDLQFTFNKQTFKFQVTSQDWGDSKRYAIKVEDTGFLFQPDLNGKFGFVVVPGQQSRIKDIDIDLLNAIGKKFEEINEEED
jgi:hypothetical protein